MPTIEVGRPMRKVMRKATLHFFRYIHTRRSTYTICIADKTLVVEPTVFTPKYRSLVSLKASELLATNLRVPEGAYVLDMGTGTGIQGIFAADRAARVIGTDINLSAARCAQRNVRLNKVTNMAVRVGDLFGPVNGEKFDLIIWLPPSFFLDPKNIAEHAFMCGRSGSLIQRFCQEAARYLSPKGFIQLSCVDRTRSFLLSHLALNGFRVEEIKRVSRFPMETVTQYLVWQN